MMNSVETANGSRLVGESVGLIRDTKKQSHSQTTLLVPLLEIGETGR